MRKWLAAAAFLLWEAWWIYEFTTAPRPDEKMQSVAAILFGGGSAFLAALLIGAYFATRAFLRLKH